MHLQANAKLTTSLRVLGRRPDGLHEVDIEMCSVDLADQLTIVDGDDLKITGPFADGVPLDGSNIVSKALSLSNVTASITIEKNIPHGAGLGGGSADAATVLRYLQCEDSALALQLGSDVAFCLRGGRARITGVGENIEPLDFIDMTYALFLLPVFVSTQRVYAEWDALGGPEGENGNDLEPAALSAYPELKTFRDAIGEATGLTPRLAGSGSTWFVDDSVDVTIDRCESKIVRTVLAYR